MFDTIKYKYRAIYHWFHCNFNKYHWALVKEAFLGHPWDNSFLTILEEKKLDEILHWFEHHQNMVDEQYNDIMKSLKIAKYCIHIINNGTDLYTYNYSADTTKGTCEYSYIGPHVNTKNVRRFFGSCESKYITTNNSFHYLYIAKCKHIYYMIRERYTDYWWD